MIFWNCHRLASPSLHGRRHLLFLGQFSCLSLYFGSLPKGPLSPVPSVPIAQTPFSFTLTSLEPEGLLLFFLPIDLLGTLQRHQRDQRIDGLQKGRGWGPGIFLPRRSLRSCAHFPAPPQQPRLRAGGGARGEQPLEATQCPSAFSAGQQLPP